MRLVLEKFKMCCGCIHEKTNEECGTCERSPRLTLLKDNFKSEKQYKREIEEEGRRAAENTINEIEKIAGRPRDQKKKNIKDHADWGLQ